MTTRDKKYADILRLEGINAKGFGIIPKFVMTDTDLSPDAKAIYAYLCAHAGNGITCYPSRSRLMADLGIAKNTYYAHLKQLIDQGYIQVKRGRFASNSYILVAAPAKLKAAKPAQLAGDAPQLFYNGMKAYGFGCIPRLVMTDRRLSRKAKALYAYFCAFAGNTGVSFPKAEDTMYFLSLGKDTYYKYLQQLITYNYIQIVPRKVQGKFAGNHYIINDFPDLEAGQEQARLRRDSYLQRLKSRMNKGFTPCPKNCDTSKRSRKKAAIFAPTPCPKNCDTNICDTENCDTNINSSTINSFLNTISSSDLTEAKERIRKVKGYNGQQSQLRELALDILAAVELSADEQPIILNKQQPPILAAAIKSRFAALNRDTLDNTVERVQAAAATGSIRNPAAYLLAALWNCTGQAAYTPSQARQDKPQRPKPSYDMDKINWMLKYGKIE